MLNFFYWCHNSLHRNTKGIYSTIMIVPFCDFRIWDPSCFMILLFHFLLYLIMYLGFCYMWLSVASCIHFSRKYASCRISLFLDHNTGNVFELINGWFYMPSLYYRLIIFVRNRIVKKLQNWSILQIKVSGLYLHLFL